LLLEFADLGSVEQLLCEHGMPKGLLAEHARAVMYDVTVGLVLAAIKSHHIHRDIKPANVLICKVKGGLCNGRDWVAKVADWGVSRRLEAPNWLARTVVGTPVYWPPEMMLGLSHDARLDSWCLGLLLLHIRAGRVPFWYLYTIDISEQERQARRSGEQGEKH
jgi:serine/threonine protein kinase